MFLGLGAGAGIYAGAVADVTAPSLVSAVVNSLGTLLTLTYNEPLDPTSVPAPSATTLGGTDAVVVSSAVGGSTVQHTLSPPVDNNDVPTVTYIPPLSGKVRDLAGNNALALSAQAVTNGSAALPNVTESSALGTDGYGGTSVGGITNVTFFMQDSVATDIARQVMYAAYHTNPRKLKVCKRALVGNVPTGAWTVDQSDITLTNAVDSHCSFSLAVDGSGRLHIAGDNHVNAMHYWRASTPGAIHVTDWFAAPIAAGSTLETSVTYPCFVNLPNGDLLLFFRNGGSGEGDLVMYRWRDASNGGDDAWHIVYANLIDGETIRSAYPYRFVLKGDILGLAWCWRETTLITSNHDQMFMWSKLSENFSVWYKAGGATQTIPATQANAGYVQTIAQNTGLENVGGLDFDESVRPLLVVQRDPGDGFSQYEIAYWTGTSLADSGGSWQFRWVPGASGKPQGIPYTLKNAGDGSGIDYLPLSSAHVVHKSGRTVVLFKSDTYGDGIRAWVCEESTYTNWTLVNVDSTVDVDDWFPQFDAARWRFDGSLNMLRQRVSRLTPIGAQNIDVVRYVPPTTTVPYTAPTTPWDADSISGCVLYVNARVGGVRVTGTPGSQREHCNALKDYHSAGAEKILQATPSDAPSYKWNGINGRGSVRFTKANLDFMESTDATLMGALVGANTPFSFLLTIRFDSIAVNDCVFSFGSSISNFIYFSLGTANASAILVGRRTGGASITFAESAPGVITAGEVCLLTGVFDGTNITVWKNGVQVMAPTSIATAGSFTTPTAFGLGYRKRSTRDSYSDISLGALALYNRALTTGERTGAQTGVGAEFGISV
jgi:hypothetical protein